MKILYLGDANDIPSKYSHFSVSPAVSTVVPATLTVATDISHRGTGIYGRARAALFDKLSTTIDITSAGISGSDPIAGAFRPVRY